MFPKKIIIVVLLMFPALSYCQALGQRFNEDLKIYGYKSSDVKFTLPMPPGWWEIATLNDYMSGGSAAKRMQRLSLHLVEENRLKMAMQVTAMTDSSSARWNDEPCKSAEGYLYKNDYGTRLWRQRCLIVRPVTFLQLDNDLTRKSLQRLNGVKFDFNAVSVIYTQYDDRGTYVVYAVHFFPSFYGLENPVIGNLNMSAYHPSRIKGSGANEKFVDSVVAYGELIAAAIDKSLSDGGGLSGVKILLPVFGFTPEANTLVQTPNQATNVLPSSQAPPLEKKAVDIVPGRASSSAGDTGIAKQLRELKELLDDGVLSKVEHDKLRKKILDAL